MDSFFMSFRGLIQGRSSIQTVIVALVAIPVAVIVSRWLKKLLYLLKARHRANQLPGPPARWLFGNLLDLPTQRDANFMEFYHNLMAEFPYCLRICLFPHRTHVLLVHPRTIKPILASSEPKDKNVGGGYNILLPWLGNGLLLSDGPRWFRNRRLLTPAFHFEMLKTYMTIYNECADVFAEKLSAYADKGETVDIYQDVSLCTLNIILRAAFSYEENVQTGGSTHPYVLAVYKITTISAERQLRPWTHIEWLYGLTKEGKELKGLVNYVHKVAQDIINKRKLQLESEEDKVNHKMLDFLDILLKARDDNGVGLTQKEIQNEVDTFLFEGHDTTASGVSWILYELAHHPEIQEKARQEVDSVLSGREVKDIQWEDLSKLSYLGACIKETMRLHSPVPAIARSLTKPTVIEGVTLLPGTSVVVCLGLMHHNQAVWGKDAMEYKPERFLSDKISDMDSYAYAPFSAGPRNCIGQNFALNEEKTVVAKLLHRFVLEVDESLPPADPVPLLVSRSRNGINIRIKKRPDVE